MGVRSFPQILLFLLVFSILASCDPTGGVKNLKVDEVKKILDDGAKVLIVDTRTEPEYLQGHLPRATLIPQEKFGILPLLLPKDKSMPLIFYCRGYG